MQDYYLINLTNTHMTMRLDQCWSSVHLNFACWLTIRTAVPLCPSLGVVQPLLGVVQPLLAGQVLRVGCRGW